MTKSGVVTHREAQIVWMVREIVEKRNTVRFIVEGGFWEGVGNWPLEWRLVQG